MNRHPRQSTIAPASPLCLIRQLCDPREIAPAQRDARQHARRINLIGRVVSLPGSVQNSPRQLARPFGIACTNAAIASPVKPRPHGTHTPATTQHQPPLSPAMRAPAITTVVGVRLGPELLTHRDRPQIARSAAALLRPSTP
jgi:hypothetical protein